MWPAPTVSPPTPTEPRGLKRTRGLIAAEIRAKITETAARRYATGGSEALKRPRNPAAATTARLAKNRPRAAETAVVIAAAAGAPRPQTRLGTVVTCQWCDAEFCPLTGAARRRFCTRSCASRHNRNRPSA